MKLKGIYNDKTKRNTTMRGVTILSNVKQVYSTLYPNDTYFIERITPNLTFVKLLAKIQEGQDFYDVLGASDSLVRERIFGMLAKLANVDYDTIYYLWLKPSCNNLKVTGVMARRVK